MLKNPIYKEKAVNYKGPKRYEGYMKKKRTKENKRIFQKTSYKYFLIDLDLDKFFIKINKESKVISKEYEINSIRNFNKSLNDEEINICDFKFGFSINIFGKKYVLYQKEEKDYHNWIRIFEYIFNCKDIGSYENKKLKEKNEEEIKKRILFESMNSLVLEKNLVEQMEKNRNISPIKNANDYFNAINNSNNKYQYRRNKYNRNRSTDNIDLNKNDRNYLNNFINNDHNINVDIKMNDDDYSIGNYSNQRDSSYYRKIHEEEKLKKLKRLSDIEKERECEKNDKKEISKIIKKNNNNYKVTLEPDYTNNSNKNNNNFGFNEAPIGYKYTKLGEEQHNYEICNNYKRSLTPNNFINESDKLSKLSSNNFNQNKKIYTKEGLLNDIKEKNLRNEYIRNSIRERERENLDTKSIYQKNLEEEKRRNHNKKHELDSSLFNEKPIKQDIQKEKILLENLHFGLDDNTPNNKFDDNLNVTVAGIPINRINKVNFSDNKNSELKIKEDIQHKNLFKKKKKEEEFFDDRKTVTTNKGRVLNVGRNIVENENDLGWTLNFSVIEDRGNFKNNNNRNNLFN